MTVSSKYLMLHDRESEYVLTEAEIVAVSGNVNDLLRNDLVRDDKAIKLTFTITEMNEPIGIGIAHYDAL